MTIKRPPIRFWIAVMIFMTTFTNYMLRSNMSISIVRMVEKENVTKMSASCEPVQDTKSKDSGEGRDDRFEWTENEQAQILAAYFWGYLITSIPAPILSEIFGPWIVILLTTVLSTVLTAITPLAAVHVGYDGVLLCRFFIGLLGGFAYPATTVLIARWAPPKEKGKFLTALMGNTLGTVCAWVLVGPVSYYYGWKWGFYCLVFVMMVFCVAFFFIVSDSPQRHRWISEEEQQYIATEQGHDTTKRVVAPYLKILTSLPFLALCVAHFGNSWGLNLILTYAPKFLSETLGFNIRESGGLAALPHLARLLMSVVFAYIGHRMQKKKVMSVTCIRKFFIIFSHLLPSVCNFLIFVAGCKWPLVVGLLIINQGLNGAVVVSHLVNPHDLAPNFAAPLFGIMNFASGTTGFIVPTVTGVLLTYYNTSDTPLRGPHIIYGISGIMFAASGLIFILFGTGKIQPWNEKKEEKKSPEPET